MKKNVIAAPRPMKRSGVLASVQHKYARSDGGGRVSDMVETVNEVLFPSDTGRAMPSWCSAASRDFSSGPRFADEVAAGNESGTSAMSGEFANHSSVEGGGPHQQQGDESDLERYIEMEGSCEIQRIFLSGLHTPRPRAGHPGDPSNTGDDSDGLDDVDTTSSALWFVGDNGYDFALGERSGLSMLRLTPAPSPAYSFLGLSSERHHHRRPSEPGGDFPLLGHSPNSPTNVFASSSSVENHDDTATVDEEELDDDDDDDMYAFFGGRRHHPYLCQRAANPMPLNTPFHAPVLAHDHPAAVMAAYVGSAFYGDRGTFAADSQNSQFHRNIVGHRAHFFTVPAGRAPMSNGVPPTAVTGVDSFLRWDLEDEGDLCGESNRMGTRNRSYSEPIPFAPATPTQG